MRFHDVEVSIFNSSPTAIIVNMRKNGVFQDFLMTREHTIYDVIEHYRLMGFNEEE